MLDGMRSDDVVPHPYTVCSLAVSPVVSTASISRILRTYKSNMQEIIILTLCIAHHLQLSLFLHHSDVTLGNMVTMGMIILGFNAVPSFETIDYKGSQLQFYEKQQNATCLWGHHPPRSYDVAKQLSSS